MLSCSSFETLRDHLGPEIAPDDVAAERQRQPAGALRPPLAEVDDLPQPFVLIRELPFVDQQPGLGLARRAPPAESRSNGTTTYSKSGS